MFHPEINLKDIIVKKIKPGTMISNYAMGKIFKGK